MLTVTSKQKLSLIVIRPGAPLPEDAPPLTTVQDLETGLVVHGSRSMGVLSIGEGTVIQGALDEPIAKTNESD